MALLGQRQALGDSATIESLKAQMQAMQISNPGLNQMVADLVEAMGDEHGAIILPSEANDRPHEGDIVWLQPGHCDPTVNLYPSLCVVADDGSYEIWPVDARRK